MVQKFSPIAIVGIGTLMPGSKNYRDFWRDIIAKKDYIREVPKEYWSKDDYFDPDPTMPDKTYTYKGGFLDPIDFPAMHYGIPPKILSDIDSSQLLSLIVTDQVFKDAFGDKISTIDRSDISVTLGTTSGQKLFCESSGRLEVAKVKKALKKSGITDPKLIQNILDNFSNQFVPWTENTFPGLLGNVIAGRITNRFDFGGENCVVDAACASALAAVKLGVMNLQSHQTKVAIVGGADTSNGISSFICFSKTPALSPTHDCRPLSQKSDGTMLGEGIAMLALKRLDDAIQDQDEIYCLITGIGASSDGRAKSIYAPLEEGQKKALNRCYTSAGYPPQTVDVLEMHGTGTKAGDKAEINALNDIFDASKQQNYCAIGSLKSQYGHTKGAAGAVSLAKIALALNNKIIPPTIKVEEPIDLQGTAFYISNDSRPWFKNKDHPRRASVSSFGFGGSNYHFTLEEYTGHNKKSKIGLFPQIIPFSASTKEELTQKMTDFNLEMEHMADHSWALDQTAQDLRKKFDPSLNYRCVLLISDALHEKFIGEGQLAPQSFHLDTDSLHLKPLVGKEIVETFDCIRETFEEHMHIAQALYPHPGAIEKELPSQTKEILLKALKIWFAKLNIHFSSTGERIGLEDLSLLGMMRTLAKISSLGHPVDYSLFEREFHVNCSMERKPKFSIKIAGYNYGKPIIEGEQDNDKLRESTTHAY